MFMRFNAQLAFIIYTVCQHIKQVTFTNTITVFAIVSLQFFVHD